MPGEDEIDIEEMESISQVQDDQGTSKEVEKPQASASSTEQDVSNTVADDDALSVVRDVVDKRKAPEAAASSAKSEEAGPTTGDTDPKTKKDDEGFSDVPFNKHPRFQEVLGKLKTAEVDATRYRNVQNFIDQNGLDAQEAAEALIIGGLIKTNPAEAWRRMRPTVEAVLRAAGEVLPDDLLQRVQNGEMSQEAALDVSRARASVAGVQATQSFQQQRAERQRQQEAEQREQGAVLEKQTAAQSWEDDRREKDPNFDAKLPDIIAEVKRLQELGYRPVSVDGVTDQLNRAYRAVNARLQPRTVQVQPRPALRPINGGQVSGNTRPAAPQNTLDIIQAELAKRAG
jgi:hypothetical protein